MNYIILAITSLALLYIIIAIWNRNSKRKYYKRILANPGAFRSEMLERYTTILEEQDLPAEGRFTPGDFSRMLDGYIAELEEGKWERFDEDYMARYYNQWIDDKYGMKSTGEVKRKVICRTGNSGRRKVITLFLFVIVLIAVAMYVGKRYNKAGFKGFLSSEKAVVNVEQVDLCDGDLIFQTSLSGQSKAIQLATKSRYSHCGIIYQSDGKYYVYEAIATVRSTPLEKWIARGEGGKYVVKRLKNADDVLTADVLNNMRRTAKSFQGKSYDLAFEWSDKKMYCSELIWKIYQRATGLEIGKLEKLSDFDLSNPIVRSKIEERYGENIPVNETVISPKSVFESDLLRTVVGK